MGESAKALLGAFILLGSIGALMIWVAVCVPSTPLVWTLRLGLPVVVIAAAAILLRAKRRKDLAPDFLRSLMGKPFERDGMCFSILPALRNGTYFLNILFQNQYSAPCIFRVVIALPDKSFLLGKHRFPGVALDIACGGGALGLVSAPIGIPAKYQGRSTKFELAAATAYPTGKGKLLRFRNGLRVGKADASGLGSLSTTVGLLAIGVVRWTKPATISLAPPIGAAEAVDQTTKPSVQILWRPGEPREKVTNNLHRALAVN